MRITKDGNVGIGIINPSSKLDVNGGMRTTGVNWPATGAGLEFAYSGGIGFIQSYDRTNSTWQPLYLGKSNVGIGTSSPEAALHIKQQSTSISSGIRFETSTTSNEDWYLYMNASDDFTFRNDGDDYVTFQKNTGNVGIGTTNPSVYKLEVTDDSRGIIARTSSTGTNYSIVGTATGGSSNYAIYGSAANGSTSWAGYFNGGLKVTGNVSKNITTKTGDYTITDTDGLYTILVNNTSATATITLPTASANNGRIIIIKRIGTQYVYIDAEGTTEKLDGSTGTKTMNTQYKGYVVQSDGTNWWIISVIDNSFKK